MKYFINFSDFNNYKKKYIEKINQFSEEVLRIYELCQNVEWVGVGHDKTIQAVYLKIDELNKVIDGLMRFVDFMDKAENDYSEGVEEVKGKFKEIQNALDEMKIKIGGVYNES